MNNKEILDNAPVGATHIEEKTDLYIKVLPSPYHACFGDWFIFECGEWVINDSYNILLMRSLSDIKRIVELQAENAKLKQDRDKRDLEHQAKEQGE